MRRDITEEETYAAGKLLMDCAGASDATVVQVALDAVVRQPAHIFEDHPLSKIMAYATIKVLRDFLESGGEILLIENGPNSGTVRAVRHGN